MMPAQEVSGWLLKNGVQFEPVKFFASDSGSSLRESKLNPVDSRVFQWSHSSRTGTFNQRLHLVESRVVLFNRFDRKIFKPQFLTTKQIADPVLTTANVSINRIQVLKANFLKNIRKSVKSN